VLIARAQGKPEGIASHTIDPTTITAANAVRAGDS
jgi:hypothetical protein